MYLEMGKIFFFLAMEFIPCWENVYRLAPSLGSEIPTVNWLLFMAGKINEIGYKMFRDLREETYYQLEFLC